MYELRNWYFDIRFKTDGEKIVIAYGDVYNHPKYKAGHHIHTSMCQLLDTTEDAILVTTYSGSIYKLLYNNMIGKGFEWLDSIPFRDEFIDKASLQQKIVVESVARQDTEKKNYEQLENKFDNGIALVFDDTYEYYYRDGYMKKGNEVIKFDMNVHIGCYQDSVLINDDYELLENTVDIRYFPYKNNRIEFYAFFVEDKQVDNKDIYIQNTGKNPIEVDLDFGLFLIPADSNLYNLKQANFLRISEPTVPEIDLYGVTNE